MHLLVPAHQVQDHQLAILESYSRSVPAVLFDFTNINLHWIFAFDGNWQSCWRPKCSFIPLRLATEIRSGCLVEISFQILIYNDEWLVSKLIKSRIFRRYCCHHLRGFVVGPLILYFHMHIFGGLSLCIPEIGSFSSLTAFWIWLILHLLCNGLLRVTEVFFALEQLQHINGILGYAYLFVLCAHRCLSPWFFITLFLYTLLLDVRHFPVVIIKIHLLLSWCETPSYGQFGGVSGFVYNSFFRFLIWIYSLFFQLCFHLFDDFIFSEQVTDILIWFSWRLSGCKPCCIFDSWRFCGLVCALVIPNMSFVNVINGWIVAWLLCLFHRL